MARSYSRERALLRGTANTAFGRQRDVLESAGRLLGGLSQISGRKLIQKTPLALKKSGIGGFIATGLAVAIVAGIAYVAWQLLRTDDKAWTDDEFDVD
ncbi:MAG: hypothetical protein JHC62_03425 [Microbacteriaceae bacterium]|nr:hypothetical protein [Microbacteriaceae bacterium]